MYSERIQFCSRDTKNHFLDENLHRVLTLKAAKKSSNNEVDIATYKKTISQTINVNGFIEYGEMWDYVSRVDTVVESLQELLT